MVWEVQRHPDPGVVKTGELVFTSANEARLVRQRAQQKSSASSSKEPLQPAKLAAKSNARKPNYHATTNPSPTSESTEEDSKRKDSTSDLLPVVTSVKQELDELGGSHGTNCKDFTFPYVVRFGMGLFKDDEVEQFADDLNERIQALGIDYRTSSTRETYQKEPSCQRISVSGRRRTAMGSLRCTATRSRRQHIHCM